MDSISGVAVRSDCVIAGSRQESTSKRKGLWSCFSCTSVDQPKSEPYTRRSTAKVPDAPEKKFSQGERHTVRADSKVLSLNTSSAPESKRTGYTGVSSTMRGGLYAGLLTSAVLASSNSSSAYGGSHDDYCGYSGGGGCSDFGCSDGGFGGF